MKKLLGLLLFMVSFQFVFALTAEEKMTVDAVVEKLEIRIENEGDSLRDELISILDLLGEKYSKHQELLFAIKDGITVDVIEEEK